MRIVNSTENPTEGCEATAVIGVMVVKVDLPESRRCEVIQRYCCCSVEWSSLVPH